jgi:hypothetical protein
MYGREASMRLSPGISTPNRRGMARFRESALTLFVARVFANDAHDVLALDDFAILTQAFD